MGANLTRYVDETQTVLQAAPRLWANAANREAESEAADALMRLQSAVLPPIEQIVPRSRAAPMAFYSY